LNGGAKRSGISKDNRGIRKILGRISKINLREGINI
jgi:hypothetical protein